MIQFGMIGLPRVFSVESCCFSPTSGWWEGDSAWEKIVTDSDFLGSQNRWNEFRVKMTSPPSWHGTEIKETI